MLTMKYIDLSFPDPQSNLAFDEALLDLCEEGYEGEILRFWEPSQHFIVVGYSNKILSEVNTKSCGDDSIPILRRPSGGGTVLQGPGCLNYALILQINSMRPIKDLISTTRYIMEKHRDALSRQLDLPIEVQGHSDLTVQNMKISGNAQRRKKNALLFHGSFLLGMNLEHVEKYLLMPSLRPDYRKDRAHSQFVRNLETSPEDIKSCLRKCWKADDTLADLPLNATKQLVENRYSRDDWNLKF